MTPRGDGPHGDEADLFRRHNSKLVATLRTTLRVDGDVARDLAQFAWLKLLETQPARRSDNELFGWLATVARREHWQRRRSPAGSRELLVDEWFEHQDPAVDVAAQVERHSVAEMLTGPAWATLSDSQQKALTLWVADYSYREIADTLGKTYTWVNRHVREGLAALRTWVAEHGDGVD